MRTAPAAVETTLRIASLAAGGDGIARHDGMAVFVPRTAVGDSVRVALRPQGRFARARVLELLEPSPDRVEAPCVHYTRDDCGGCQWQHLSLEVQRAAKAQVVVDAFARIGRRMIATPTVHGDAQAFGYRRTMSFTVRRRAAGVTGGLHAASDPDVIVPVETCLLAHADLRAAWDAVRERLTELPASPRADLRVTLRRLDDARVVLAVHGGDRWPLRDIASLVASTPSCRGIWWTPVHGEPRLVWDADALTPGAPDVSAGDALAVAASFVQVNGALGETMHAHVVAAVWAEAPRAVVDGYAGSGRLALALDRDGIAVTAIELDARASRHTAAALSARSRAIAGRVEQHLAHALPADVVVLNPPRAGCDAAVCDALVAQRQQGTAPHAVIYVSCDPATLARDVHRLAGYRVDAVTCFDLFPQTAHVETVCVLRPEAA